MYRKIKISAVIPVYNGGRYLEYAVQSVCSQTLPPMELIIVDDGSTDDSIARLDAMQTTVPTKIIRQQNQGQSGARNQGVCAASGDYIALLDQDDRWERTHLEVLARVIKEDPEIGWVYSNLDEIDAEGCVVTIGLLDDLPADHPKRRIKDMLASDMFILPGTSLIRRSAFVDVGGFDERLSGYEDDDFFLRMFRKGWKNAYIPISTLQWRVYASSTSYTPNMARSRRVYFEKLVEMFPDDPVVSRRWIRTLVAPRLFMSALGNYLFSLSQKDWEVCGARFDEMKRYASFYPIGHSLRIKMYVMRWPALYYQLYRAKHIR